jgi:ATP-dependent DNA helicase
LEKSAAYASILKAEMEKKKFALPKLATQSRRSKEVATTRGRKRPSSDEDDNEGSSKRMKRDDDKDEDAPGPRLKQPALVTGAKLKDYQLEGVEWMISLDQNGISGILGRFKSGISFMCSYSVSS